MGVTLHSIPPHRRSLWGLLLLGAVICGDARAQELFPVPLFVSSEGTPRGIATGQLSSDGLFDVVTSSTQSQRIVVHRGRLDGTFLGPVSVGVDGEATALQTVDFDHDGLVDVVWADVLHGRVGVLYQLPTTPTTYRVESVEGADEPASLALWDENGDGWEDVVVAFRGSDTLGIVRNVGGALGTLRQIPVGDGPTLVVPIEWPAPRPTALGVVQQGWLSRNVGLFELSGTVGGTFPLGAPSWLNVLDRNGDPWPDLAILDAASGQVREFNGNDQGAFDPGAQWNVEPNSERIELIDATPGQRRWLVGESSRLRISAYEEQGAQVVRTGSWFVGSSLRDWDWADFDLDGSDELVVPLPEENGFQVLETRGGRFLAPEALDTGSGPTSIVRVDEPGSSVPAVSVLAPGSHELWVYEIVDNTVQRREVQSVAAEATRQAWGDLDGNGRMDAVLGLPGVGLDVLRRDGAGEYLAPVRIALAHPIRDLLVDDLVGSPAADIAVAVNDPDEVLLFEGDGAGNFGEPTVLATAQVPIRVRARDLNLDGRVDLVVVGEESQVSLYFADASGFRPAVSFGVGTEPRDVNFGFFNADVYPDIVVANGVDRTFSVLASVLPGIYTLAVNGALAPSGAERALVGDFNGDGLDDVIFASPSSTTMSIHTNSSTGGTAVNFTLPARRRLSLLPVAQVVCPVDGDGVPDLLSVDLLGSVLVVVRSDPESTVPAAQVDLSVTRAGDEVRLRVTGEAQSSDQFVLRRQRDGAAMRLHRDSAGLWSAIDAPPYGAGETYVLSLPGGETIHTVHLGPAGVDEAQSPRQYVASARTEAGTSVLRFRTVGGTAPEVRVYDLRGRHVASLPAIPEGDDWYRAVWDGSDDRGRTTARGRYLVEVRTRGESLRSSWLRP